MKLYSLYDKKAGSYLKLIEAKTDGEAVRMLQTTLSSGDSLIATYPSDFRLDQIGLFDMITGEVISKVKPVVEAGALAVGREHDGQNEKNSEMAQHLQVASRNAQQERPTGEQTTQ